MNFIDKAISMTVAGMGCIKTPIAGSNKKLTRLQYPPGHIKLSVKTATPIN